MNPWLFLSVAPCITLMQYILLRCVLATSGKPSFKHHTEEDRDGWDTTRRLRRAWEEIESIARVLGWWVKDLFARMGIGTRDDWDKGG